MENKYLISNLQLAYSPLSAYDFTVLKKDTSIHKALNDSSLYAIVQRGELRFDNICSESYKDNVKLSFEIRQKGNPHVLQCSFLVYQKNLLEDLSKEVVLCVGSSEAKNDLSKMPFFNIQGIKLLEYDKFKIWFSPEKFLQNYWKGYFNAEIKGDLKEFTKYTVLYVGKATNQDIWKRLSGHETLQDILALEEPIYTGSIPKDEIAILFFKIEDNIQ